MGPSEGTHGGVQGTHGDQETHGGLQFGERWNPDADIAANVRRAQIAALASSRAEKVW